MRSSLAVGVLVACLAGIAAGSAANTAASALGGGDGAGGAGGWELLSHAPFLYGVTKNSQISYFPSGRAFAAIVGLPATSTNPYPGMALIAGLGTLNSGQSGGGSGGNSSGLQYTSYNDVWLSRNGHDFARHQYSFQSATLNAPWARRYGHSATLFQGQIVMHGGGDVRWSGGTRIIVGGDTGGWAIDQPFGDLWVSTDAVNWVNMISMPGSAAVRRSFAMTVVTTDTDGTARLLVCGGASNPTTFLSDCSWTTDLKTFTTSTTAAPWGPRAAGAMVAINGLPCVMGGMSAPTGAAPTNDMWCGTPTGDSWTLRVSASQMWSGRAYASTIPVQYAGVPSVMVSGGISTSSMPLGDTWVAGAGGISGDWVQPPSTLSPASQAAFGTRFGHATVAYCGFIYAVGGFNGDGITPAVDSALDDVLRIWDGSSAVCPALTFGCGGVCTACPPGTVSAAGSPNCYNPLNPTGGSGGSGGPGGGSTDAAAGRSSGRRFTALQIVGIAIAAVAVLAVCVGVAVVVHRRKTRAAHQPVSVPQDIASFGSIVGSGHAPAAGLHASTSSVVVVVPHPLLTAASATTDADALLPLAQA